METLTNLWQQNQHRLATAACMVLIVLMMGAVVDTTLFVLDNMQPMVEQRPVDVRTDPRPQKPAVALETLNLFGKLQQKSAPRVVDAPKTKLNLELLGVFNAEEPQNSAAIIGQRNDSDLYGIGDKIASGATLDSVFDDHILIRRGSRLEKLSFPNAPTRVISSMTTRQTSPATSKNTSSSDSRLNQIRQRIEDRRNERSTGTTRMNSPGANLRAFIESNRNQIDQDPDAALAGLGVSAVEQGSAKGYRVSGQDNPMLSQAGLKDGDVILSVNGKSVGVAMNDSALIDQALAQKRVRVEVQRDSRRFFLTVPIP